MHYASITFESEVDKRKCEITVDLSADYDKPIAAEAMRQLLVQIAIRLTDSAELESLVRELAPGTAPKALAAGAGAENAALAPPLLRPKLKLLKK